MEHIIYLYEATPMINHYEAYERLSCLFYEILSSKHSSKNKELKKYKLLAP